MTRDPFAQVTRKVRLRAQLLRARRFALRPLRPTRIARRRSGPPNLLLIGIDTLRYDHLGLAGYARRTSPHLDALAADGISFDQTLAAAPWTLPSFASALCGVAPSLHGAVLRGPLRNMSTQPPERLPESATTLARHLARHGYRTAAFYSNQFFAFGLAESFQRRAYHNLAAADLAAVAAEWIRRHADRPFFCFVLFNDPHEPTTPSPTDLEVFWRDLEEARGSSLPALGPELAWWGQRPDGTGPLHLGRCRPPLSREAEGLLAAKLAVYDATIVGADRAVGALRRRLEDWRLAENTLVAAFADHGEEFLDHLPDALRWDHDPRDLRAIGHGQSLFQELLHVPWLAAGPGVPVGVRRTDPVSLCDLAPTLADWLGVPPLPVPATRLEGLAGISQARQEGSAQAPRSAAATGNAAANAARAAGSEAAAAPGAFAAGGRTLLAEAIAFGPDLVTVRRGRWKLIAQRDGSPLALYDLRADPAEKQDQQRRQPKLLAELGAVVTAWRAEVAAAGTGDSGGSWDDVSDEVRRRLRDLGYAD